LDEVADLTGMKKAEVESVKAFATRQIDRARPAYGRVVEKVPRRSIDWATTNDDEYLQSQTGNRRFWPLKLLKRVDIEALRHDRLQLLGEAAHYESEGESVVLAEALWPKAAEEQEKRRVKHPWEDILDDIPQTMKVYSEEDGYRTYEMKQIVIPLPMGAGGLEYEEVTSADLLTHVLGIPAGQQRRDHSMTLASCMKRLGWERSGGQKVTINGQRVRGYRRAKQEP
jgi:predicted P-loop ATPase